MLEPPSPTPAPTPAPAFASRSTAAAPSAAPLNNAGVDVNFSKMMAGFLNDGEKIRDAMETVTPRELDATLRALDAQWNARFDMIDVKLEARDDRLSDGLKNAMESSERARKSSDDALATSRSEGVTTRWALVGLFVATVAAVIGIVALGPAFFESGRNVGASIQEVSSSLKSLERRLDESSNNRSSPEVVAAPPTTSQKPLKK